MTRQEVRMAGFATLGRRWIAVLARHAGFTMV